MAQPTKTKQWLLKEKPTVLPALDGPNPTFELVTKDIPALKDGEVLLQALYWSNDPAQRGWIASNSDPERLYVPPVKEGEVMRAIGIWKIIDSKAESHPVGTLVNAWTGWTEYAVVPANGCTPIQKIPGLSVTHFLGGLGGTGLTAYYGLIEIIGAKAGESLVVSGAAGATGSMVVQIAKHIVGCSKVIGLAGTDEKCRWVEALGADKCINYKDSDWKEQLKVATEGFVDMYFDNVGGEQLDFMLRRMKREGRIAACGAVSDYNDDRHPYGIQNWLQIIIQRLAVKGFIVIDYVQSGGAQKAIQTIVEAIKAGKITLTEENETVVSTKFEDIPKTWMGLFSGKNRGKLVTKLV